MLGRKSIHAAECFAGNDREVNPVCEKDIVEWLTNEYVYADAANWSNRRVKAYIERSSLRD
jgi:hypothetical protein